ncbi:MAG: tetratricopeptide repeat protein [Chloroflexi bacterium]|nr:tetratricopeptide repeat protein [Chloroflexota bacterium]
MTLISRLTHLETAGLLRLTQSAPELEYLFRHALVQDAAYTSLLKQDRRLLHRVVGEVLEYTFPERLNELAPMLAQHFAEAGDATRAMKYFTLAGEIAASRYANAEATMHYRDAINIAHQQQDTGMLPRLYRARGLAYDAIGDFERARADHEAAVNIAQQTSDLMEQSRALLDLGMLWAGRDYTHTGEYYQHAYELARSAGDPSNLAYTLNRLGNWHINVDQPAQALEHHEKALAIFKQQNNPHGLAETLDFLGMASMLSGDLVNSAEYYQQAIALFRQLDDRRGTISSLTALALLCPTYQAAILSTTASISDSIRHVELALDLARQSRIRSAEVFSLVVLADCQGSHGDYSQALAHAYASLTMAQEIGHSQWMTFAQVILGRIHQDIFNLSQAREHLEQALALAKGTNSRHWIRTASGFLASVCIEQNDLTSADNILQFALPPNTPARTVGQRASWYARAELALAQHDAEQALHITAQLINDSPKSASGQPIIQVAFLRGKALAALHLFEQAEAELQAALMLAARQGARFLHWRILAALGQLAHQRGNDTEAARWYAAARDITLALADSIPDESLRTSYMEEVDRFLLDTSA